MIAKDRWSLVTGLIALNCGTICQGHMTLQDKSSHVNQLSLKTGFLLVECVEVLVKSLKSHTMIASLNCISMQARFDIMDLIK